MSSSWATSIDLHLELRGPRVRRALEEALRDAVRQGQLASRTRLPSSRSLAADLGIARNTVAEAYAQLCAEGWLESRQGSGTRVARVPVSVLPQPPPSHESRPTFRYDLQPGSPDVSSFPRQAWLASARRVLTQTPDVLFGYGDPRGAAPLRDALCDYLSRVRGVRATPDRVVVCSGFTQALGLVCRAIAGLGGRRVGVEGYGLSANWEVIASAGLHTVGLQVDDEGADLGGADVDAAIVTPAHQFPLGSVMSPARRSTLIEWARSTGGVVVEDDYDGEFRFDRHPVGSVQGLAPDQVIYAGTASKTLAPGVRVGWLVVPDALIEPLVAQKSVADRQSGVLDQLVLAELISSGRYDRHVRRRRFAYRSRRDRLIEAIQRSAPECEVRGISAGLHALVTLPDGLSEDSAVAAAATRSLGLQGLEVHRLASAPGPTAPPALVIGYATPPDHSYRTALDRLCDVLGTH